MKYVFGWVLLGMISGTGVAMNENKNYDASFFENELKQLDLNISSKKENFFEQCENKNFKSKPRSLAAIALAGVGVVNIILEAHGKASSIEDIYQRAQAWVKSFDYEKAIRSNCNDNCSQESIASLLGAIQSKGLVENHDNKNSDDQLSNQLSDLNIKPSADKISRFQSVMIPMNKKNAFQFDTQNDPLASFLIAFNSCACLESVINNPHNGNHFFRTPEAINAVAKDLEHIGGIVLVNKSFDRPQKEKIQKMVEEMVQHLTFLAENPDK